MARPQKYTVDYFSHDANATSRKTLSILFNNFGHEGISAWWQLLESISLTSNHVISIKNPEDLEYLAAKLHFRAERLREILDKLCSLEAIDFELYKNGLIWCQNFVDRLKPVYDSRKQELPHKPVVSLPNNPISLPNNPISLPDNTQTKETKLKENKLKENKGSEEGKSTVSTAENSSEEKSRDAFSQKESFDDFKERMRLKFSDSDLDFNNEFEKWHEYWFEGSRKCKNPKLALHNWLDKAREFKKQNKGNGNGINQANTQQTTAERLRASIGKPLDGR